MVPKVIVMFSTPCSVGTDEDATAPRVVCGGIDWLCAHDRMKDAQKTMPFELPIVGRARLFSTSTATTGEEAHPLP